MSLIEFSVTTRGGRMDKLQSGDPLDDYGAARRCSDPACDARLSRYNPSGTCSLHSGWRSSPQRRRRT